MNASVPVASVPPATEVVSTAPMPELERAAPAPELASAAPAPANGVTVVQASGLSAVHGLLFLAIGLALGSLGAGALAWYSGRETADENERVALLATALVDAAQADERAPVAATPVAAAATPAEDAAHGQGHPAGAPAAPAAAPTAQPSAPAARSVNIAGFAFKPAALTVPKGTTVSWTNADTVPHSIVGSGFTSPLMGKGARFSRTFDRVGTFTYQCGPHPTMKATVTVTAA